MSFIRKALHLQSQFSHDNFADAHIDPSHPRPRMRIATALLRGLGACGCPEIGGMLSEAATSNGCPSCLLCGCWVARGVRMLSIIGTVWHAQALSNLLISLSYLLVEEVQLAQLTLH
jgi:hypothetical protein